MTSVHKKSKKIDAFIPFIWLMFKPVMWLSSIILLCRIGLLFSMAAASNYILGHITDSIKFNDFSFWNYGVMFWTVLYLICWSFGDVFSCISNYFSSLCYPKLEMNIRMYFSEKMYHAELYSLQNKSPTYLVASIDNVSEGFQDLLEEIIEDFIPGFIFIVFAIIYFAYIHIYLSLLSIIWIVVHSLVYVFISKKSLFYSKKHAAKSAERSSVTANQISNLMTTKMFNISKEQYDLLYTINNKEQNYYKKYLFYDFVANMAVSFVTFFFQSFVFYYILIEEMKITQSVGHIIQIITINFWVLQTVYNIAETIPNIIQKLGQVIQSFDILQSVKMENCTSPKHIKRINGKINVNNLNFKFHHLTIFKNFSIEINPGEKILITGISGTGKSTLFNLLIKVHNILPNTIFIDNKDITQLNTVELRSHITYITQTNSLFDDTIWYNLTLGKHFTLEEVQKATDLAELTDVINNLPDKYETHITSNLTILSGGQIQRIAIARGILHHEKKSSKLILCDEITSALDNYNRSKIIKNVFNNFHDNTILWIDHRLELAELMSKIIVIGNNGEINIYNYEEFKKKHN